MRLYYPLSSLNAMLEMQETDIRELAKKIRHELEAKKEKGRYPDSDPRRSDRLYDPTRILWSMSMSRCRNRRF